jgi:hypothetical protein
MDAEHLSKIVREHYPNADHIFTDIIRACHTLKIPISYALTLIEGESAFENVFGHDPVANPIKGGRVSRARYYLYRFWRRRGRGMQGVGYTQLTWYAFQDAADKIGGCWRPYPNIVTGLGILKGHIHQHGLEAGAAAFNGFGPAANAYGRNFVRRQKIWHERLT